MRTLLQPGLIKRHFIRSEDLCISEPGGLKELCSASSMCPNLSEVLGSGDWD
ncbi:MAG: hypothetical protein LBP35_04585 [Candidatus Ancillula trichonymphae]|nr:hypothetical protein [Candidatus Ancillula trichonymphae]